MSVLPPVCLPSAEKAPLSSPIVIAIDGPSASGKSTLSRLLAQRLGFAYVDTGAMYRTLAWWCLVRNIDVSSKPDVKLSLKRWQTRLVNLEGEVRLLVDGYFPAKEIRTPAVTEAASKIAVHPSVREWMVAEQRRCVKFGSLVMEGRDIGSNVFPETDFKFFIDASTQIRQLRRSVPMDELASRDHRDSQRAGNPLMPALGAYRLDNTNETPEMTLQRMLDRLSSLGIITPVPPISDPSKSNP